MFKPGAVMYARAASEIARHTCAFCGVQLTAHQGVGGGICDKPECHARMIEKVGQDLIDRKRRENTAALNAMFERMAPEAARAAEAVGGTPDSFAPAKVPYQGKPVVPLPQERRDAFKKHLGWIVARAFTEEIPDTDLTYRDELEEDEPALVDAACGSCQGGCCALGGTSGFLHDTDISRWRQRDPGATAGEITDYYLSMVPDETTEDACIYQGATGCALPRARRNDQCNAFHCKALKLLQERLADTDTDTVVIIADDNGTPRSVAGWSPDAGKVTVYADQTETRTGTAPPGESGEITFGSDDFR